MEEPQPNKCIGYTIIGKRSEFMFINQYGYCSKKIETQYIEVCPNIYIQLTINAQRELRRERLSLHQLLEILKRGEVWLDWSTLRAIFLTTREGLGVTVEYRDLPDHGYILSVTGVKPVGAWIPPSTNWFLAASRNRRRIFTYKRLISYVVNGICGKTLNLEEHWMERLARHPE